MNYVLFTFIIYCSQQLFFLGGETMSQDVFAFKAFVYCVDLMDSSCLASMLITSGEYSLGNTADKN